jgi:hypothetical protein
MYSNIDSLRNRLAIEKRKFIESLIKNRVHFNLSFDENNQLDYSKNDLTTVLIDKLGRKDAKHWI